MSVTFQSGVESVTLRDPEYVNSESASPHQALGRTAAGDVYVYDKGVEVRTMTFEFRYLDNTEKEDLEEFHRTTVKGAYQEFSLTDHRSRSWMARFVRDLEFSEILDGRWNCTVVLEVEAAL